MYNEKHPSTFIIKVTKLSTIIELFLDTQNINILFSEVEKLIRIYLTIPMSNATAEKSFSALKRLKTYLRATMGQKRLNH